MTVRSTSTPPTMRKHLRSGSLANASWSVSITSLQSGKGESVEALAIAQTVLGLS